MGLRKSYKRFINQLALKRVNGKSIELELQRLQLYPTFKTGSTNIFGKPFKFHDSGSFLATYNELFGHRIYEFNPSDTSRTILDCGANMGLSVLYFSMNYPQHKIIAFEPDAQIFRILSENVNTFGLSNVELHQKAVWTKVDKLRFYTDGRLGGRINEELGQQEPVIIESVPLLDFLSEDVDFLKLDIEGAEDEVLRYCGDKLRNARHIFFEYHNNIHKQQTLHELLKLVRDCGFHYYIKESGTRGKPFVDQNLICESYDMALNVFCYKA